LAVGSVAEISVRAQVHARVRVRVLRDVDRLERWLIERIDIADVNITENLAAFTHQGDRESEAALLRAIVEAGFPVIEFGAKHKTLEDVFLHVTEGRVQ